MKKILIIGKKSFLGLGLLHFFKRNNLDVNSVDFKNFLKKKKFFFEKFNFIINCTSNIKFIENKYNSLNDHDLIIAKKIIDTKTKLITLSTRKVYKSKYNIKENDTIKPSCKYSANKFISENSVQKILHERSLILRISNVIGFPNNNKRKLHKTFVDIFFDKAMQGYIYNNKNIYKDFISINKFNEIILKLISNNAYGIFNVSLGKKVYLSKITKWLNFYNKNKITILNRKKSFNNDNFTLNNNKLLNKIKIKINLTELKKDCLEISKNFFIKK